jgi:hypothetical protein
MFRPHRLCQGNPSTTPNSLGLKRFLLIVIPKSDSEGDRPRDLTMRRNHYGGKAGGPELAQPHCIGAVRRR